MYIYVIYSRDCSKISGFALQVEKESVKSLKKICVALILRTELYEYSQRQLPTELVDYIIEVVGI